MNRVLKGWDQVYVGDIATERFEIPHNSILRLACCDCGHTQDLTIKVKESTLEITCKVRPRIETVLRRNELYPFVSRQAIIKQVEKMYAWWRETRTKKKKDWQTYS